MPGMIETCNEALAEIGADTIASIDEASVAAGECRRWYKPVLADLLEIHDWGFSIRRVTLAEKPNDRVGEWSFAYAKPANVASLMRIVPIYTGVTFPDVGWWRYPLWDSLGPEPYVEDAQTIYCNLSPAVLEYAASAIDEALMPALFRRAFVYELASRLAMPVRKDRQVKGDMIELATRARWEAIADDQNRYPRQQQEYASDVALVRDGWMV